MTTQREKLARVIAAVRMSEFDRCYVTEYQQKIADAILSQYTLCEKEPVTTAQYRIVDPELNKICCEKGTKLYREAK